MNKKMAGDEKIYKVLNPCGIQQSVELHALAPRLDTIDGKTIYVNMGDANAVVTPALFDQLNMKYPKTDWRLIFTSFFGPAEPEEEVLKNADAVIRGLAW